MKRYFFRGFRWGIGLGTLLSAMFLFYVYVVSQQNLDTSERATAATHIDTITTAKYYDLKGLEYSLGRIDSKLILVNFWGFIFCTRKEYQRYPNINKSPLDFHGI